MKKFNEWLEERDPELHKIVVDESFLKRIGQGIRNTALTSMMGISALGGVDQVANQVGTPLSSRLAMDDEMGDNAEVIDNRRRQQMKKKINSGISMQRHRRGVQV